MHKVFISYARDESCGQDLAVEAQSQLELASFNVFRDVTGVKGGDFWLRKLEEELRASHIVVLVLSEKVLTSKWVPNEINLAEELGIPVIPIFAERIQLPLWLRHLQVIDFVDQMPWMQLYGAIVNQIGVVSLPTQPPATIAETEQKIESPNFSKSHPKAKNSKVVGKREAEHEESYDLHWASNTGKDQYGHYADLQVNDVIQRFRLIQSGTFRMGSPESEAEREGFGAKETRHQVTLSQGFWLADTTCTQALWKAVLGNNSAHFKDNENNPVEQVSWHDCEEFIQTLNGMKSGLLGCLPTEAQWEYACRAGTNTPFSFGENITPELVNYDGNSPYADGKKGGYRKKTVSVKSLPANSWGLYEMHGNVWEWCQDVYQEDLGREIRTDPLNQKEEGQCVVRGGSWYDCGWFCRSADRNWRAPDERNSDVGFRLALVN